MLESEWIYNELALMFVANLVEIVIDRVVVSPTLHTARHTYPINIDIDFVKTIFEIIGSQNNYIH